MYVVPFRATLFSTRIVLHLYLLFFLLPFLLFHLPLTPSSSSSSSSSLMVFERNGKEEIEKNEIHRKIKRRKKRKGKKEKHQEEIQCAVGLFLPPLCFERARMGGRFFFFIYSFFFNLQQQWKKRTAWALRGNPNRPNLNPFFCLLRRFI